MTREEKAEIKRKTKERHINTITDKIVYYRAQGYIFKDISEKVGMSERATRRYYDIRKADPNHKVRRNAIIALSRNWIEQTGQAI